MRHLGVWILLLSSLVIIGSWAMKDEDGAWGDEGPVVAVNDPVFQEEGTPKKELRESKRAQKEAKKAKKQKKKDEKKAKKEANKKKKDEKKAKQQEKKSEKLKKEIEKKGKFPPKKVYLLWEQYLIDLDLQDKLDYSEPESYKDGFMGYLEAWSEKMDIAFSTVRDTADRLWTRELKGKNTKDNWIPKILQWTLKGECSAGSLTDEEQSLSTALKAWGEVDIAKDPEDARIEALTKIIALAKTANLMNDDGKICLCI